MHLETTFKYASTDKPKMHGKSTDFAGYEEIWTPQGTGLVRCLATWAPRKRQEGVLNTFGATQEPR